MKNISKWLVVLLFAATTSLTYTACNKKSVAEEKCAKECSADSDKKCKESCEKVCCTSDGGAHADACKAGSNKKSCSHKKGSDAVSTDSDSTSTEEAHHCDESCHANGCTYKS